MNNEQVPYFHAEKEKTPERCGVLPVHPSCYNGVAFPSTIVVVQSGFITFQDVMQYSFYNYSNVPVTINGMFLDRYFSGSPTAPTYLNSRSIWIPTMLANEMDTSNYQVAFLDTYYADIQVHRRLYVVKKLYAPIPVNREF